jgi:hypothetical protein
MFNFTAVPLQRGENVKTNSPFLLSLKDPLGATSGLCPEVSMQFASLFITEKIPVKKGLNSSDKFLRQKSVQTKFRILR